MEYKSMSALGFCRECGHLYQKHYSYCPFCGNKNRDFGEADETVERAVKKGAKAVREAYLNRLIQLEKRLGLLDRELDTFIVRRR
jgi:hypothetical protein